MRFASEEKREVETSPGEKRGAEEKAEAPDAKKPCLGAVRAAPAPVLALTAAAAAGSRASIPTPARRGKKVAAATVSSAGVAGSVEAPAYLEDLRFPEGVGMVMSRIQEGLRWFETGAKQLATRHEDDLDRYSGQLASTRAKLKEAQNDVKTARAELEVERAKTLAAEVEAKRARDWAASSEARAAMSEAGLKAARDGQGDLLRAFAKRLLLSDHGTGLANDLAALINGNAAVGALEKAAKDWPGLDISKYGYKRLEGAAIFTQYAAVVRDYLGRFPQLEELAGSSELLTAELVEACSTDREPALDAAFDALPGEDMEIDGAGAGVEEERTEPEGQERAMEEPSSSGAVTEGVAAGGQPTQEKEVGDS